VLERSGIPAEACLYIGDRDERDGACARSLGVHYLLKTRRAAPDRRWTFHRYDDLLPWLEPVGPQSLLR
jgi:FMN phosphatase YigB (HAD superfamily)